ncbi:MAG: hypothetical protein ACI9TY_000630 [Alphaproteobacteria bacterium]|jgi:hypothetical protein
MKSTVRFEIRHFYATLTLLFFVMASIQPALAGYGLKLKDAYLTFFIEVDDNRIAKLIGLPLEGDYLFDLNKASLIFTPQGSEVAYKLSVSPLERALPKALFSRDTKRDGVFLLGYDTVHWRLSTNNKDCKEIYSSKKLGDMAKITMTDLSRINIALAYITGQNLSNPCSSHVVSKAVGNMMGLPLHSYSMEDSSDFEVKKILEDVTLTGHKMPENIVPFNEDAQADYLETLLTENAYKSYLQTVKLLGKSGITKVKALKQLLKWPENRRKILPNIGLVP